jgi:hypothetical protein
MYDIFQLSQKNQPVHERKRHSLDHSAISVVDKDHSPSKITYSGISIYEHYIAIVSERYYIITPSSSTSWTYALVNRLNHRVCKAILLTNQAIFMLNAILIHIFNELSTNYVLRIGAIIDLIVTPAILAYLVVNLVLLFSRSRLIKIYLFGEIMLLVFYIVLLASHLVYNMNILFNDISIFGFVRLVKSGLMIFACKEMIDTFYFFNRNIYITKKGALEKKATLNIEVVLQMLNNVKEKVYGVERDNIDYCIRTITNNKLFIPKIFAEENNGPKENNLKNEIAFWVQNFEKIERMLSEDEIAILRRQRTRLDTSKKVIDEMKVSDIEQLNRGFSGFMGDADSEKIVVSLMKCFNLDFNVFDLKEASNGQELVAMMYYVFYHLDYFNLFNIRTTKYINFAKKIQSSYHSNPYHNATHGADVMQVRDRQFNP